MSRRRRLDQSARLFLVAVAWEPMVDRLDRFWVDSNDAAAAFGSGGRGEAGPDVGDESGEGNESCQCDVRSITL